MLNLDFKHAIPFVLYDLYSIWKSDYLTRYKQLMQNVVEDHLA